MNKVKQGANRGFTIVELLIVIVVIGILAAITIVAYTGITTQANQKTALGNAQSVKSVADTYYAEKGSYPSLANISSGTYAKVPAGVTVVGTGPIAANNTNILYAVTSDGSGACFGYIPSGGSFTGTGSSATVVFSGSATSLTNVASPVCS